MCVLLLLGLCTAAGAGSNANGSLRHLTIRNWQINDGLPQNSVNCLLQSREGYLWFGTQEGLVRFDGVRFVIFDRRNTEQIRSNYIWTLLETGDSTLWIGTRGAGLVSLKHDRFEQYGPDKGLQALTVTALASAPDGTLWIGTENGLFHMRGGIIVRDPRVVDPITTLAATQQGMLWVSTTSTIALLSDSLKHVFGKRDGLLQDGASVLLSRRNGEMVVCSPSGVNIVSGSGIITHTMKSLGLINEILCAAEDKDGMLWLGTSGSGILRLGNGQTATLTAKDGLPDNLVKAILQDREESVWLGTYGSGLVRLHEGSFITLTSHDGLPTNFVLTVCQSRDGALWAGTYGGGACKLVNGKSVLVFTRRSGLPDDAVGSIAEDSSGALWFGTPGGLARLQQGRLTAFRKGRDLPVPGISALVGGRDGSMWIGTYLGGLLQYKNGKFRQVPLGRETRPFDITSLLEDGKGSLWVGTSRGLFHISDTIVATYTSANGLASDHITSLYQDHSGSLWIGTVGGLTRRAQGVFKSLTAREGLFDDLIFSILEDDNGALWMSCNRGVWTAPLTSLNTALDQPGTLVRCASYSTVDGMNSPECVGRRQPCAVRARDGKLWYPTIKGLSVVDPAHLRTNTTPPNVLIESVIVDGTPYPPSHPLRIPAGHQRIEIRFTAVSFVAPSRIIFNYRLDGSETRWNAAGGRTAAYTTLPSGTYIFRVSASNTHNIWNEVGASFVFTVESHFYETAWFYFGVIAGGIAVIWLIIQLAMFRARKRQQALERVVEERTRSLVEEQHKAEMARREAEQANTFKTRILSMAAHDLQSPLATVRSTLELIDQEHGVSEEHKEMLRMIRSLTHRMMHMVSQFLSSAALESGRLVPRMEETDFRPIVQTSIDNQRYSAEMKRQTIAFSSPAAVLVNVDPHLTRQIIDNLLGNAIKYSPFGSTITVEIEHRHAVVRIAVKDQGPGFSASEIEALFGEFQPLTAAATAGERSTGLGLSIVKQLAELQHGRVGVETIPGGGSTFIVEFPAVEPSQPYHSMTEKEPQPAEPEPAASDSSVIPANSETMQEGQEKSAE